MKKIILIATLLAIIGSCAITSAETKTDPIGVIWLPCINVRMPIYNSAIPDVEHEQKIIDTPQSALIERWNTAYKIGDHAFSEDRDGNQWNIQKIFPGAYAWIYTEDATYFLECYETAKTEYDGNEYINGRLITPASSYDILLSCCAEDAQHHFVALFRRIAKY